jgi:hypothetical protein
MQVPEIIPQAAKHCSFPRLWLTDNANHDLTFGGPARAPASHRTALPCPWTERVRKVMKKWLMPTDGKKKYAEAS